jgi:hypothetical protein
VRDFKTRKEIRTVKDAADKEHKVEIVYFEPPLVFVKGRGYIQKGDK